MGWPNSASPKTSKTSIPHIVQHPIFFIERIIASPLLFNILRLHIKQDSVKIKAGVYYEIDTKTENNDCTFIGLLGRASNLHPYTDTEDSIPGKRLGQVAPLPGISEPGLFTVVLHQAR
jgi:hypothetical protein